jgi:hypothetical protein
LSFNSIHRHTLVVEAGKVWAHAQDRQHAKFQLQSNALHRKINAWSTKQQLYIPGVAILRAADAKTTAPRPPYLIPLWLPSQIGAKIPLNRRFAKIEWQLRIGQAYESLELLPGTLQICSYLFRFKDRFVRGQTANTRAQSAISTVQARIDVHVKDYRAAHAALLSLGQLLAKIGWQDGLRPLADADVREITEGEEGESEGRRRLSWIWKTIAVGGLEENEELRDGLRIEWCRSRARAMRFTEEVELLQEEMERVLRFLQWQENWWRMKGRCEGWGSLSEIRIEALQGYADRQAALRRALHTKFSNMWRNVPEFVKLNQDSISNSASVSTVATNIL